MWGFCVTLTSDNITLCLHKTLNSSKSNHLDEALVLRRKDEEGVQQPRLDQLGGVELGELVGADGGGDLADGGEARDEDAVGGDAGGLVLAELDEAVEAVEPHDLLGEVGFIAQSGMREREMERVRKRQFLKHFDRRDE